ncbi:hypothetical protein [Citrobacter amalonaticus]|uniref:hypothetical protein n=1 Tax=Citrobacter amalonaticus TaxID=35703 RepID=UPI001907415B|nr:hypothetical protein [Citrobacter amalonaticus]MBJ8735836.1 hypothetical protein [Citrobacter amalonaticus]
MYSVRPLMRPLLFLFLLPFSFVQASDKAVVTDGGTNPLSVTRIHDRVNYMTSLSLNNGKTAQQWHSVDCKQGEAQLLYKDILNEEGLTKARFYGKSYLHYAPAQEDKHMTAEDIRKVCQLPIKEARWERLSATSTTGITDLVDVNSIQRIGNILSVRMGYDFADIIWEPPYDAPLVLKIEHYLYNCKTHQGDAVAAMNFDSEGRVTDSLITADIVRRKSSFNISPEKAQRFAQLCQLPAGKMFTADGHFVPAANKKASTLMGPTMPDLSNNNPQWLNKYPLSTGIEKQAQSLIKPWALPRFKQILYTEASAFGKVKVQLDVQPDGYIRKLEEYGIWTVQRLTLANQLQLKFAMSISSGASLLNKLQTDLHFPLVKGQRYQAQWDSIDADEKVTAATLRCDVTEEGNASSIAPEFSGKYLLVECHETHEGQRESSNKLAWLQEFNVFVPVTMQVGDKPESSVKLENVSVIR